MRFTHEAQVMPSTGNWMVAVELGSFMRVGFRVRRGLLPGSCASVMRPSESRLSVRIEEACWRPPGLFGHTPEAGSHIVLRLGWHDAPVSTRKPVPHTPVSYTH